MMKLYDITEKPLKIYGLAVADLSLIHISEPTRPY